MTADVPKMRNPVLEVFRERKLADIEILSYSVFKMSDVMR